MFKRRNKQNTQCCPRQVQDQVDFCGNTLCCPTKHPTVVPPYIGQSWNTRYCNKPYVDVKSTTTTWGIFVATLGTLVLSGAL